MYQTQGMIDIDQFSINSLFHAIKNVDLTHTFLYIKEEKYVN